MYRHRLPSSTPPSPLTQSLVPRLFFGGGPDLQYAIVREPRFCVSLPAIHQLQDVGSPKAAPVGTLVQGRVEIAGRVIRTVLGSGVWKRKGRLIYLTSKEMGNDFKVKGTSDYPHMLFFIFRSAAMTSTGSLLPVAFWTVSFYASYYQSFSLEIVWWFSEG